MSGPRDRYLWGTRKLVISVRVLLALSSFEDELSRD